VIFLQQRHYHFCLPESFLPFFLKQFSPNLVFPSNLPVALRLLLTTDIISSYFLTAFSPPNSIFSLPDMLLLFFADFGTENPCYFDNPFSFNTAFASSNSFSLIIPGLSCIFFGLSWLKNYYSFSTSSSPLFSSSYFTSP
jgi:hypothetical protein